MNPKNVLVLFGGTSPEHDISIVSAASVIGTLNRHTVIPVYITREGKWLLYDGKLDNITDINWEKFGTPAILSPDRVNRGLMRIVGDKVKIIPVDVVLPVLHGPNGEDGTIQGLCELAGIPYMGCGVAASAVAMDKGIIKTVARGLKIPQGDFLVFGEDALEENLGECMNKIRYKLGYPCFVKPNCGGSSIGVSKAENRKELKIAIEEALKYSSRIIVEKFIKGREVEVGIFGNGITAKASVVGEIIADGEFYDFEAKYEKAESKTIVPADLPEDIVKKIQDYALEIYRAIDCKGLSRVDFFVAENGKVLFNELNTLPGFTPISMYAKMWEECGVTRQKLIEGLINLATGDKDHETHRNI